MASTVRFSPEYYVLNGAFTQDLQGPRQQLSNPALGRRTHSPFLV